MTDNVVFVEALYFPGADGDKTCVRSALCCFRVESVCVVRV